MRWNPFSTKQWATIGAATVVMACGQTPGSGALEPKWSSLYSNYLNNCKQCHAPNAAGKTSDTESSLDFSTAATAYTSVTSGSAGNLMGNFAGCNGKPFVVSGQPDQSLLVAVLSQPTRQSYSNGDCNGDAISDETVKLSATPIPDGFTDALKTWITNGAQNN